MNSIQSALTCVHSPTHVPPGNLARIPAGSPDNIKNDNLSGYPAGYQADIHATHTVCNQNVVAGKGSRRFLFALVSVASCLL